MCKVGWKFCVRALLNALNLLRGSGSGLRKRRHLLMVKVDQMALAGTMRLAALRLDAELLLAPGAHAHSGLQEGFYDSLRYAHLI